MSALALRPDAAPAGERWTLDIDIAERAGLGTPGNIRRTIVDMVDEGIINDSNVWRERTTSTALYQTRVVAVPVGTMGGTKDVTEYLLNDDAALLVLLRLRTPEALAATADLVNGIRERATTMLAAAREEGRQAGLAAGASFEKRIAALERRSDPKQKALAAARARHPHSRENCRPQEERVGWPEKIRAFLADAPVGSTFTTAEILRQACGIDAPDWADLSTCGLVAIGVPGFRKLRKHTATGKITTYTRTA